MNRQMMLTIRRCAARQVIFCTQQTLTQSGRFVRRSPQPAERKPNAFVRNLPVNERKALRHGQLMRQTQNVIQHPR